MSSKNFIVYQVHLIDYLITLVSVCLSVCMSVYNHIAYQKFLCSKGQQGEGVFLDVPNVKVHPQGQCTNIDRATSKTNVKPAHVSIF